MHNTITNAWKQRVTGWLKHWHNLGAVISCCIQSALAFSHVNFELNSTGGPNLNAWHALWASLVWSINMTSILQTSDTTAVIFKLNVKKDDLQCLVVTTRILTASLEINRSFNFNPRIYYYIQTIFWLLTCHGDLHPSWKKVSPARRSKIFYNFHQGYFVQYVSDKVLK